MTFSVDKVGSEFRVNSVVTSGQARPSVTQHSNGGFVIVWYSQDPSDGSGTAIKSQLFDALGQKVGSEFLVNTISGGNQLYPEVVELSNGGFVVTWMSVNTSVDGSGNAIAAQLFDASGAKVGSEFLVNTYTTGNQWDPHVTCLANGNFVITWATDIASFDTDVRAQIFDQNGVKIGSEILVNTQTTGLQSVPEVASPVTALTNGGFIITWQTNDATQDGNLGSVKAQIFDATGAKVGTEFVVNSQTTGNQADPAVTALTNGGFVVAWGTDDTSQDGNATAIKAQVFDASGAKLGSEFLVNTQVTATQANPAITTLPGGRFVVTWSTNDATQDGSGWAIKAQVFDSNGAKLGTEFLVNTQGTNDQLRATVGVLANGDFVIAWETFDTTQDGSSSAIKAQIFRIENAAPVAVADSGDATEAGVAAGSNAIGNVLTNDTDADSEDSKVVSAVSHGAISGTLGAALAGDHGSLTLNADGSYVYAVNNADTAVNALRLATDTLTDSFSYTMHDAVGAASSTTLTITIHGADDAPVAVADDGLAVEAGVVAGSDATGNVLTNDTDADAGDSKTVSAVAHGATNGTLGIAVAGDHGSLTLNADGSYTYAVDNSDPAVNALQFTSDTVTDTFGYTMHDGAGATSSTSITITIHGANDAPTGAPTASLANGSEDTAYAVATADLLLGFSDPDGDGLFIFEISTDNGSIAANGKGDGYIVTPAANSNGLVTLTYTVSDGRGGDLADQTRTFTLAAVNDAPTGTVTISGTPTEDQTLSAANTLADADGLGTIAYEWLRDGAATGATGTTYVLGQADVGHQISVKASYTDQGGTAESVTSGQMAPVANVNDAPTGTVTISGTATEDQTLTASNSLADEDGIGTIGYQWLRDGVATGATGTTYVLDQPDVGHKISVKASYTDGQGTAESVTSGETATVANVNDAPVITSNGGGSSATISMAENSTAVTMVTATDADSGTTLTYSISGGADMALFAINATNGQLTFNAAPDFEAPSDTGKNNTYDVTVRVSDGALFDEQALAISITDVADVFTGTAGNDIFSAPTSVNWTINGLAGDDKLTGNSGNDTIDGGPGKDVLTGGAGIDTVTYASATAAVAVSLATTKQQNTGGGGSDTLAGFENLTGSNFNDTLTGDASNNVLHGGTGNDRLIGGAGADDFYGDAGADTFILQALTDSTKAARDYIHDFNQSQGDVIDLSAIDAITGKKDDAFSFQASGVFSSKAGQLIANAVSSNHYLVEGDVDGNGQADFSFFVDSLAPLAATSFVL